MNFSTLWLFVIILVVYFTLVFSETNVRSTQNGALQSRNNTDLEDETRTRKYPHRLWHLWGWHALAIAYWVKVKLVIVGFFVGSAVFAALRYVWPNKCSSGIVHDTPTIVYDHPPLSFAQEHVPYSLDHSPHFDHSFTSSSNTVDPYSGYAQSYSEDITATEEVIPSIGTETHSIKRRSLLGKAKPKLTQQGQQNETSIKAEERIAELIFEFLGLDSVSCRRRFICEMEFRSRLNPFSSMAFRIVGRGFFEKYTNSSNEFSNARSFAECAAVNPECIFIEQNVAEVALENTNDKIHFNEATIQLESNLSKSSDRNTNFESKKKTLIVNPTYKTLSSLGLGPKQ